jgi:hypothetical protein
MHDDDERRHFTFGSPPGRRRRRRRRGGKLSPWTTGYPDCFVQTFCRFALVTGRRWTHKTVVNGNFEFIPPCVALDTTLTAVRSRESFWHDGTYLFQATTSLLLSVVVVI